MMSNSSSSSNSSLLHPLLSSINFSLPPHLYCLISKPSSTIATTYLVTYTFILLPLSIFILFHGVRQWREKRSTSSVMSHSDCIVYHSATYELIATCGGILFFCGIYNEDLKLMFGGICLISMIWHGQTFFHILSCVERYLAVVHPITYRNVRNGNGIRVRNISIGCVWLLCFAWMGLLVMEDATNIADLFILVLALLITSFCSLSVLCALIRPGPQGEDGGRERVDQSKQRAFNTIVVILGVLVMRFTWGMVRVSLHVMNGSDACVMITSGFWLYLPSSLVLPLLFLHRAGKLGCRGKKIQSG